MTPEIALIIWAIGLIAWVVIRIPHQRRARRIKVARDSSTPGDRLALSLSGVGLALVPIIYAISGFPTFADYTFQPWQGWIGLVVMIAFLWLFYASHKQLGKNWSVTLEIRNAHELVTDGLYRFVRHPMYASFWLWALAQAFLLPNWIAGFAGLIGVGILYFCRVGHEEQMMRNAFGEAYDAYAKKTGRVIPRPW